MQYLLYRGCKRGFSGKDEALFYAFMDLEKAFDRMPREVVWWSLRKLEVEDWLVKGVVTMYDNGRTLMNINSL